MYMCTTICYKVWLFCCMQKPSYEMRIIDWSSDVCSTDLKTIFSDWCVDDSLRPELLEQARRHLIRTLIFGDLLTHDKDTVVGAHFLGHRVPQRFANGLALEISTFRQPRIGDFGSNRGTFSSLGRLNLSAFRWRFFASRCDASRPIAFLAGDRGNDGANIYLSSAFRDIKFRDKP